MGHNLQNRCVLSYGYDKRGQEEMEEPAPVFLEMSFFFLLMSQR